MRAARLGQTRTGEAVLAGGRQASRPHARQRGCCRWRNREKWRHRMPCHHTLPMAESLPRVGPGDCRDAARAPSAARRAWLGQPDAGQGRALRDPGPSRRHPPWSPSPLGRLPHALCLVAAARRGDCEAAGGGEWLREPPPVALHLATLRAVPRVLGPLCLGPCRSSTRHAGPKGPTSESLVAKAGASESAADVDALYQAKQPAGGSRLATAG